MTRFSEKNTTQNRNITHEESLKVYLKFIYNYQLLLINACFAQSGFRVQRHFGFPLLFFKHFSNKSIDKVYFVTTQ